MTQIPKIIHYCWFGKGVMPPSLRHCLDTWKKVMPDYEIKCWSEDNFDVNITNFTHQAYKKKKWSFVSDFVRLYALYTEGGIYMDTDVEVYKPFDHFLNADFFSAVEYHEDIFQKSGIHEINSAGIPQNPDVYVGGMGILVALIGAKKGNFFVKELLDFFSNINFIREDGSLYMDVIHPAIAAKLLEKHGFKYKNELQRLPGNIIIYPDTVFVGSRYRMNKDAYALHIVTGSWREKRIKRLVNKFIKIFR